MSELSAPLPGGTPVSDTGYRDYNGPLHTRAIRWWIVAAAGLRMLTRRPGFWILSALSVMPYLSAGLLFYFQSFGAQLGQLTPPYPVGQKYAGHFWGALEWQQLSLFLIALMVGAGSIAADNRTNALLVYLSKPLTKGDYLLGKWMGVFLMLFLIALVPALVLYAYCLISFRTKGFLSEEPLLILRLLGAAAVPAAIHASLLLGFSAWSKTPRLSGAIYAGVYMVGGFVSQVIGLIVYRGDMSEGILLRHMSIGGVISGLTQLIYGVTILTRGFHRSRGMEVVALDPPVAWITLAVAAGLVVGGLVAARAKIQAVEVIRG